AVRGGGPGERPPSRPGGRDRLGDPSLLRRLPAHPAHRRGARAHLSVLPRGDGPARCPPRGRRRRGDRRDLARRPVGEEGRSRDGPGGLRAAGAPDERDRRLRADAMTSIDRTTTAPRIAVRLFAGAAAEYGADAVTVEARTLQGAIDALREGASSAAGQVISRSSFLLNAVACTDPEQALAEGDQLDVLPP